MKSLSSFNDTAIDNPHVEPIRLLKVEFSGLTLYLCDRVWGDPGSECVFDSQLYEPLILSWGTIECGRINPITYEIDPGKLDIVIDNNTSVGGANRFSALFSTYDPHYATVTGSLIFKGASAAGDKIDIVKGKIEDLMNMSTDQVTVTCSAHELVISNQFAHDIVDEATYASADPDDIGKMLPQGYGRANKVPFMAIDVGALTTLSEDITSTSTTIKTSDASKFPASGTVLVDNEKIDYSGKSGDSLTGLTRAASSTQAAAHEKGAIIGEVVTSYIYAIGHAVKAIDDVYVDNVKQETSEYTAYTGRTGDEHPSYGAKGVIAFSNMPRIRHESLDAEYEIFREATNVPIGRAKSLDPDGHILDYDDSTTITFQSAPSGTLSDIYVEYEFEFRTFGTPTGNRDFYLDGVLIATYRAGEDPVFKQFVTSPYKVKKASWPANATKSVTWRNGGMQGIAFTVLSAKVYCTTDVDDYGQRGKAVSRQSTNTPAGKITSETAIDTSATITFPAAPSGTLSDIEITITWGYSLWGDPIITGKPHYMAIDGINVLWVDEDGNTTQLMPTTFTILKNSWQTSIAKTASRLDQFRRAEEFVIRAAKQSCFTDDFTYDLEISGNSMADAVIGGRVSADIQGFQDDAAGTYTGTPNAIIERPDHILKHLIIDRCGLASSEIDATTYAAAGVFYNANSFRLAVVILRKPNVRAFINRIAHQAKSIEFWEAGVHHLVHIPASASVNKALDEDRVDLNAVWTKYTDRVNIKNTLSARYKRNWSGYSSEEEADRSVVTATAAGSVAKYGTLEGEQLSFPYIIDETQAQAILDWILGDWDEPRLVIELAGGYYLADVERGDIIGFSLPAGSYLTDTLLELVSESDKFRVIDKIYRPDAAQQIQMVKV